MSSDAPLFTPEERDRLRSALLDRAANDPRISAAAITGSAAAGLQDRWSDVDLAFAVADPAEVPQLLSDWTEHMYRQHLALHHVDIAAGAWIYRVFLLPGTLQADIAFVPAAEFRPLAPTFRVVFGEAAEPRPIEPPPASVIIGLAWLYALHARTSIVRGKLWQAEYMISGARDQALTLACLRHGLPAAHGRGLDQLPTDSIARFEASLVRQLDPAELLRAFQLVLAGLLDEIRRHDSDLAARLEQSFATLANVPQVY